MTDQEVGPLLSTGFWLHHAALTWRAELDSRLRSLGLTPTQFLLLASVGWLEHLGGPPTQQEVADQAGADRMMTSKVVRALGERGLLDRRAHESDARALCLSLTAAGWGLTRQATAVARDVDSRLFGENPEALRNALRGVALLRGGLPE